MTKRFTRYLLDGGFSFDDEYIPPRWSIIDRKNNKSPFRFLEFEDEYKDICDEIVDLLNELHEDNQLLHQMNAEAIDFMYDNFDLSIMSDRELNNICNDMGWELSEKGIKIDQLEKENEELKKRLQLYGEIYPTGKWIIELTSEELKKELEE